MRYLLWLLLLAAKGLDAQTDTLAPAPRPRHVLLKSNVTTLLFLPKQAYSVSLEIRPTSWLGVEGGVGAFFHSFSFAGFKGEYYKGLRARAGVKWHPPIEGNSSSLYIALVGKYHDIRHREMQSVLRQGAQYVERYGRDRRVLTKGLGIHIGSQYFMGRKEILLVEPYLGMGYLFNTVTQAPLPPDAEPVLGEGELLDFRYREGKGRTIDLMVGLYLGIALW